jgi:uncharacterized protein
MSKVSGETNLGVLLKSMQPVLDDGEYVFCTVNQRLEDLIQLEPVGFFQEEEGITLILLRTSADRVALSYNSSFRMITLSVHSSLEAVGFMAAIAIKLSENNISVNPISAYYHDHLFVPVDQADKVMELLRDFNSISRNAIP